MFITKRNAQEKMWESLSRMSSKVLQKSLEKEANVNQPNSKGQLFWLELLKTQCLLQNSGLEESQKMLDILFESSCVNWQKIDSEGFGLASALIIFWPSNLCFKLPNQKKPQALYDDDFILSAIERDILNSELSQDSFVSKNRWASATLSGTLRVNYNALSKFSELQVPIDWSQPLIELTNQNKVCPYLGDTGLARAFSLLSCDCVIGDLMGSCLDINTPHPIESCTLLSKAVRYNNLKAIENLLKWGADPSILDEKGFSSDNPKIWPQASYFEIQSIFQKHVFSQLPKSQNSVKPNPHRL